MKKLITVLYSTTIEIEIPQNITTDEILKADEKRFDLCEEQEALLIRILKNAGDGIEWRDGEITDIQDAE